jgi:hypothetical protein
MERNNFRKFFSSFRNGTTIENEFFGVTVVGTKCGTFLKPQMSWIIKAM